MPDETNTTEESPASSAAQDAGANIVSAAPEILSAPPEAAADVDAQLPEAACPVFTRSELVESAEGKILPEPPVAEKSVADQTPVSESKENAPEPPSSPASVATDAPESRTAHIPVNEPLASRPENGIEPLKPAAGGIAQAEKPELPISSQVDAQTKKSFARELLAKGRGMIQSRKRKKLDKVMNLFLKHPKIKNDEVEKLLHVSDATATRLLTQLEKENKIRQVGKTGHAVWYEKF